LALWPPPLACFLAPLDLPCFLQLLVKTGVELAVLPFWAVNLTSALLTEAQRFLEFSSKPFLPPCMVRTNLETGASGTESNVVRIPPLWLSMRPTRSTSIWPCRAATRSGSGLEELLR